MLPPTATSPPTLGANTSVAELPFLPATRSESGPVNELNVTQSPMGPLATAVTPMVFASCDVVTLTESGTLAVALPMVKPDSVTVKAAPALTVPFSTVSTIKFSVCDEQLIATLVSFVATAGAGDAAKKFAG